MIVVARLVFAGGGGTERLRGLLQDRDDRSYRADVPRQADVSEEA